MLNCIHIFIVTGSFLYWCVMRPASQRFFIHSCIYLRILIISYLATFLGTIAFMCWCVVKQSIIKLMTWCHYMCDTSPSDIQIIFMFFHSLRAAGNIVEFLKPLRPIKLLARLNQTSCRTTAELTDNQTIYIYIYRSAERLFCRSPVLTVRIVLLVSY